MGSSDGAGLGCAGLVLIFVVLALGAAAVAVV